MMTHTSQQVPLPAARYSKCSSECWMSQKTNLICVSGEVSSLPGLCEMPNVMMVKLSFLSSYVFFYDMRVVLSWKSSVDKSIDQQKNYPAGILTDTKLLSIMLFLKRFLQRSMDFKEKLNERNVMKGIMINILSILWHCITNCFIKKTVGTCIYNKGTNNC